MGELIEVIKEHTLDTNVENKNSENHNALDIHEEEVVEQEEEEYDYNTEDDSAMTMRAIKNEEIVEGMEEEIVEEMEEEIVEEMEEEVVEEMEADEDQMNNGHYGNDLKKGTGNNTNNHISLYKNNGVRVKSEPS